MSFSISAARSADDLKTVAELFLAYQQDLGEDLTFQDFDEELTVLPGDYEQPRGEILLARLADNTAVGCVALRPLKESGICEMKRMFVSPSGRGLGVGRALATSILGAARARGYHTMKLDTLPRLDAALRLYKEIGFEETDAYYDNPIDGTLYLSCKL